jgi:hypothetical protein
MPRESADHVGGGIRPGFSSHDRSFPDFFGGIKSNHAGNSGWLAFAVHVEPDWSEYKREEEYFP